MSQEKIMNPIKSFRKSFKIKFLIVTRNGINGFIVCIEGTFPQYRNKLTRIPLLTTLPLIARYLRQAHPLSITGVFDVNVEQLQIVKSTR